MYQTHEHYMAKSLASTKDTEKTVFKNFRVATQLWAAVPMSHPGPL